MNTISAERERRSQKLEYFSVRGIASAKRTFRYLWWLATLQDGFWARKLASSGQHLSHARVLPGGELQFTGVDFSVPRNATADILFDNIDRCTRLSRAGARFLLSEARLLIEVNGIRLALRYAQDLQVMEEVKREDSCCKSTSCFKRSNVLRRTST